MRIIVLKNKDTLVALILSYNQSLKIACKNQEYKTMLFISIIKKEAN